MSGDKTNTTRKQSPLLQHVKQKVEKWGFCITFTLLHTVRLSTDGRSQQNAQWIPQSPQTDKGIVGRVRVPTGPHSTSLSPSLTQPYFCTCAHQRPRQKICTVREKLFHNGRARKLQGFISRPLLEKQTLAHVEFRPVNFLHFMSFTSRYLP